MLPEDAGLSKKDLSGLQPDPKNFEGNKLGLLKNASDRNMAWCVKKWYNHIYLPLSLFTDTNSHATASPAISVSATPRSKN